MDELPTDALYDLARPMDVAVSPDGTRVAFRALEYDPAADERRWSVFVVPADGGREPYRLTRASDAGAPTWSPDGSRLGVVMTRERDVELRVGRDGNGGAGGNDGDDGDSDTERGDPEPQVWAYDLDRGGDARQVTDREHGVRDFDWGPEGERVVVAARDPTDDEEATLDQRRDDGPVETERLQHSYDGYGYLDTVTSYLFVVDVDSRESRRLDGAYGAGILDPYHGLQPAWHPTDERIAFLAYHGDDPDDTFVHDVHVVDADTGDVETLTDREFMAGAPTWSPDGSRLAFPASDPENWYVPTDLRVVDLDSGTDADDAGAGATASRALTAGLDRGLAWFQEVVWLDDDRLLTAIGDEGWSRFLRVSADGGYERVYDRQSTAASVLGFDVGGVRPEAGGSGAGSDTTLTFVRNHHREGIDVFAMDPADLDDAPEASSPARLTDFNRTLVDEYEFPEVERVTFAGGDGDEVEGIAFHPPSFDPADPDGDRPLLVSIHGGPRRFDFPYFDFDVAYWVSRGYVVLKVNYHGSTSYGRAFCEALGGRWNDVEVEDVLAGTDELVERGWVDPDRLFVTGFSYGGRATAYLLAESDRFAAGAAEHGSYDLRAAFGSNDTHRKWELEFGLPWEEPDAYDRASSITDVDEVDTPLLLTAGEQDRRCRSTQAEQLHVSLRKRDVPSKLVVYDTNHVHHYIAEPERATHRLETLSAWFERFDPAASDE